MAYITHPQLFEELCSLANGLQSLLDHTPEGAIHDALSACILRLDQIIDHLVEGEAPEAGRRSEACNDSKGSSSPC